MVQYIVYNHSLMEDSYSRLVVMVMVMVVVMVVVVVDDNVYLLSKGTAISPVLLTLKRLTALSD